jgi:hypothetical protein
MSIVVPNVRQCLSKPCRFVGCRAGGSFVNRIFGIIRGGAGRVGLVGVVMTATVVALALPAGANTGHDKASQD